MGATKETMDSLTTAPVGVHVDCEAFVSEGTLELASCPDVRWQDPTPARALAHIDVAARVVRHLGRSVGRVAPIPVLSSTLLRHPVQARF